MAISEQYPDTATVCANRASKVVHSKGKHCPAVEEWQMDATQNSSPLCCPQRFDKSVMRRHLTSLGRICTYCVATCMGTPFSSTARSIRLAHRQHSYMASASVSGAFVSATTHSNSLRRVSCCFIASFVATDAWSWSSKKVDNHRCTSSASESIFASTSVVEV